MNIQAIGFLILVVGVLMLIFSAYLNIDWLPYLSIVMIIVGALTINYKKITGGS
jgi:hypothetical protein